MIMLIFLLVLMSREAKSKSILRTFYAGFISVKKIICSKTSIETLDKVGNMLKVKNKDTRKMPLASF